MPANFLLVALLVVGAVGVSLGLVPDARELAFMQYRAQNIEEAEKQLSAQVEAGVLDAAVVNPLIDVYVNVGKVDAAIRLLETYTASAPDDVSALGKLASLFRFAQRTGHFLAAFEALTESAPTRERLRDLIDLYQFHGRYVAQERVLARYVALGFGQPDDYEELALLQAALNDFDGALRTMVAMESRFARRVNDDVATLHVALLLDRGDVRGAIERARRYIRDVRDPHGAAAVAGLMQARGLGPQAYDLLQPIAALAETSETLTAVLIDLEIETGRREAALRRLATLDRTGKLPDNRGATLIDLTLAAGRVDQAFELTQRFDPELLPDWLLIGLIESAIQSDRILLATDLTTRLGDDFLATKPTLAAGLALRQGRRDLAERWIQVAANDPRLPLDEQLELARLFARTDRVERAIALMTKLAEEPATPLATIGDLALLYIERDRAAEGLTLFRRLRRERASPSLDAGWARLEAKVGDARTVLAWLSTARQPDSQLLVDLFHIASDRKQLDLALLAAELDFRRSASNAARRRFAEGLIAAGQPREALLHLRQLLPGDTELRRLYAEALSKAGQADELAKLWLSELESLPDDDPQTAELIYALIDLKQDAAILPRLERLARLDGSRWFHVYVDAAKRAGAIDALVDFIAAELARTDLEPAELEARYFVLHEAEPERAFEILGRLAQSDPDRWSARYIEALRERDRGGDVVALLIERLGRPDLNQARREETIYALIEAGQHAVVLPHLAELARRDGAKWFFAYVDAAKAADAEEQLLGFIEAELDRKDLPPAERETRMFVLTEIAPERALTMLGRLAESDPDRWFAAFVEALRAQGRNEEVTRLLLARIERPDLPEAQRREAVFALIEAGQHMAVLPHLERLAANQGGDWVFAYGKSALAAGRSDVFLAFVRRGLEAPAATDAARQTLVYAALEIIGARPVLPLVREFALGGAASWFDVYADLATKADAGEELAALAEALLERVRPGAAEFDVRLDRLVTLSPTRALALLDRESRRDPARWVEPHLAVLDRLRRRADMPAVLRRALDRPGIPKAERDRRLFALIDIAGAPAALPYLRRAAESDPDPWLFAYVDALIKLGRKEELATFLGGRALDARQTPEIRRQLAFQLLELDRRDLAEPAFRALAASAAPDSNDVGQLLYLWGPRPTAAQIDWIEARAQGASGEARLAWLRKLLDVNAYARVIAFYERQPDDAGRPAYIEALVRLRDGRRLAAAIEGRIAAGAGVEELRQLARLGEQESQLRPALGALQALLAKQPDDAPALAQAGRIAFYLNRRNEARDALARLLARAPGDYQSNFIYAEVLAAEKRIAAARPHFQRALELVRAEPVQTYPMRLTEAQTLQRLGRREEALAAFKDLVEERPRDASLRADYVAALLDAGRTAEARQMLTGQ